VLEIMSPEFKDDAAQNGKKASQDDLEFIAMMASGTTTTENGSYEMPLPFRQRPVLPNNCDQVEPWKDGSRETTTSKRNTTHS